MPVLTAQDITKSYGGERIIENVSFHVEKGEKIGVVGVNGAGKTTLLNIIAGDESSDSGQVYIPGDITLGYLRQHDVFDDNSTLMDEVRRIYRKYERMESELSELSQRIAKSAGAGAPQEQPGAGAGEEVTPGKPEAGPTELAAPPEQSHASPKPPAGAPDPKLLQRYGDLQEEFSREGGFSYKSEMRGILSSMAFTEEEFDRKIGTFSGGERTRLALACLLMEKPDILLLDEPTNHLDIGMLKWLEQYMKSYRGAVLVVSHDRYFLDQMTDRIFDVENRHLKTYNGNYSAFAEAKRREREADLRAYSKQQDEIRRQEEIIRKFKERGTEHLAKRAASREKKLENMELIERPESTPGTLSITFHQRYKTGNDVFFAEDLAREFPGKPVFSGVDLDIKRGERICIVGANGIGKTTLLKVLKGDLEPTAGYLKRGVNVDIGYYDQRQESLDPGKTVMDEIHDTFRLYKDSEIRGFLGRFMFKGDSVFARVGDLSGGEKARLALLKLMMSGTNVLLLDEPTNHLDIDSKEVFEEALQNYPGTIIAVSHDRYFLNRIADKIYELSKGGITKFEGGYDYYEEKKAEVVSVKGYLKELKAEGASGSAENSNGASGSPASTQNSTSGPQETNAGASEHPALSAAEERKLKKQKDAEERRMKRRKEALEKEIGELENRIGDLEKKMCEPEVLQDVKKLNSLAAEAEEAKKKLDADYEEWVTLST